MSRGQGRSGGRGRDYTAFLLDRLLSQLVVNQAAQDELTAIRRFRLRKAGHSPVPDSDAEAPGPGFWMVGSDLPPESVPPPASRQEPLLVTRQVGQRIRDELEARVVAMELLPTHDLALSCDLLYGFVAEGLITLFSQEIEAQLLRQSVRFRRLHAVGPPAYVVNDRLYALSVSSMPTDPRTLCMTLGPVLAGPDTATIVTEVALSESGRYRVARFFLERTLAALTPALHELSRQALVAGDQWIESFVLAQLAAGDQQSVERLYRAVRRSLPEDVGRYVRIYLVNPTVGGGIQMDEEARRHSLSQLRGADYRASSIAPVELLTDLLMARFPVSDTVAREIVPSMMTVIRSPLEIPSGNKVGLAQQVIYGPTGMVIQPLVAFEQLWVEAAYPANLRGCIERQLAAETPAIASSIANLEFDAVGTAPT